MRTILFVAALACATPAWAHHGGEHARQQATTVSQERALEIARAQGVATVDEIKLDEGVWEVEGRTDEGRRIEIEISAANGAILKREVS